MISNYLIYLNILPEEEKNKTLLILLIILFFLLAFCGFLEFLKLEFLDETQNSLFQRFLRKL